MAYASVAELREFLGQVTASAANDAKMARFLEVATDTIRNVLGFDFAGYELAASKHVVSLNLGGYRAGSTRRVDYLRVPYYEQGTLTAVEVDGEAITDYEIEADDHTQLYREDGWLPERYDVTAKWGYGDPPAAVQQVALEIATNLWRSQDRGMFSEVIGAEGGTISPPSDLTAGQYKRLMRVREQYLGVVHA